MSLTVEQRRQEFERRRKELADQQPKPVKPRQRKTPKQGCSSSDAPEFTPVATGALVNGVERVVKKRQKKGFLTAGGPQGGKGSGDAGSSGPVQQQQPSPAAGKPIERGIDYRLDCSCLIYRFGGGRFTNIYFKFYLKITVTFL